VQVGPPTANLANPGGTAAGVSKLKGLAAQGALDQVGLRDAHDAVFSCGVLVLDADEGHAAVDVTERGHRLGDVALV
jgi:hypothetical protein